MQYQLSEIWIYPIKLLGGIRLKSAEVLQKGLKYDRRWMLINGQQEFMTQRVYHSMALFKQSIEGDQLTIQYKENKINLPLHTSYLPEPIQTKVWDDKVITYEVDKKLSEWFSHHLGMSCKLVMFPEDGVRYVDSKYAINQEQVSLADAYPFLIIGEKSLADLNNRLAEAVPMNRFRPNFVFSGGSPFDEDGWTHFKIGDVKFERVKPCSRCVLTTIDQQTGLSGKEPLATLSEYRKQNGKVNFGQNLVALSYGNVYEGNSIILE